MTFTTPATQQTTQQVTILRQPFSSSPAVADAHGLRYHARMELPDWILTAAGWFGPLGLLISGALAWLWKRNRPRKPARVTFVQPRDTVAPADVDEIEASLDKVEEASVVEPTDPAELTDKDALDVLIGDR